MPLLRDSTPLAVASMLSAPPEIPKPKPAAVRLWDAGPDDDVNLRGERVINLTRPLSRPPSSALQDAGASEEVWNSIFAKRPKVGDEKTQHRNDFLTR